MHFFKLYLGKILINVKTEGSTVMAHTCKIATSKVYRLINLSLDVCVTQPVL